MNEVKENERKMKKRKRRERDQGRGGGERGGRREIKAGRTRGKMERRARRKD